MTLFRSPRKTRDELVAELNEAVELIPGNNYEFTQPVQMRMNELIDGVRADVAVKLFGDDLDQLITSGQELEEIVGGVPGAADVKMDQVTDLPVLSILPRRDRVASNGVSMVPVRTI